MMRTGRLGLLLSFRRCRNWVGPTGAMPESMFTEARVMLNATTDMQWNSWRLNRM